MTIEEAKVQWKISHQKICEWLDAGLIPEVQIIDGAVHIPDVQLLIPPKGTKITVDKVREYILKASAELRYIDYRILTIQPEQFSAILLQLEENNMLFRDSPDVDCLSNRHFLTTPVGEQAYKKKQFGLKKLKFELGFLYKVLSMKAEVEFEKEK